MNNKNTYSSGGMSLAGVLTVIFVVLKLIGLIEWSWLWVLSPIWISCGLWVAFMMIVGVVAVIYAAITEKEDK